MMIFISRKCGKSAKKKEMEREEKRKRREENEDKEKRYEDDEKEENEYEEKRKIREEYEDEKPSCDLDIPPPSPGIVMGYQIMDLAHEKKRVEALIVWRQLALLDFNLAMTMAPFLPGGPLEKV